MKNSIIVLVAVAVWAMGSPDAQAAKHLPGTFGGNLTGRALGTTFFGTTMGQCITDYIDCNGHIIRLCRRLVQSGMGGGSMKNCKRRKRLRCESKYTKCKEKVPD